MKKNKFFIFSVIAVFVIFIFANFFQSGIKPLFYSISNPIQKFFWQMGDKTSDFLAAIVWVNKIKEENNNFYFKNQELLCRIAVLEELEKENEQLKKALDIELNKEFTIVLAQLIGKDVSQDFILLDKGAKNGIQENMPVITAQKVLVGKISEVYDNYSKAMLISNKECSFDAKIEEKEISGIIRGKGNLGIFFDLIPQEANITKDDIILSSNLAGVFPANILVGKVLNIKKNDTDAFQQAEIIPAFNIKDINYFFVVTNAH